MTEWHQPRTRAAFHPLKPAEEKLLAELDTGRPCKIGDTVPPRDPPAETIIRASFLRWCILRGPEAEASPIRVHEKGVQLQGAYIEGDGPEGGETRGLDLAGCAVDSPVDLFRCRFPDPVLMRDADLAVLALNQCALEAGLSADRLNATGGVFLRGAVVDGEVGLLGATLGGDLDCDGGRFRNAKRDALSADRLNATGDVVLRGVVVDGEVGLLGATLGGSLSCDGGRFRNAEGTALDADGLNATGSVFLRGAVVDGAVRLLGATLGGDLDCDGGRFRNAEGTALHADGLNATGSVFLRGAVVDGAVRLLGATLGGDLDCDGGRFRNAEGTALHADRLNATGGVFLRGAVVDGAVRLLGATLGGSLSCDGGRFRNAKGNALSADGLNATGDVFLRGVVVDGEVGLLGATLGGDLDCDGGRFRNAEGDAEGKAEDRALNLQGAVVKGIFFLRGDVTWKGALDLLGADIAVITDEPGAWPAAGNLLLDRCRYGAFVDAPVDAASRLAWLGLQDPARGGADFWPQPYEQCARVLRETGHQADTRVILIEKERLQRAATRRGRAFLLRPFLWLRDQVLNVSVRYGHRPLLALAWLAVFFSLGTVWFDFAAREGAIKPNTAFVLRSVEWATCRADVAPVNGQHRWTAGDYEDQIACFLAQPEAKSYPRFDPWIYSADTLLPIVSLEMQEYWIPDETKPYGAWARVFLWFQIAMGWFLSLLAVAGFSGLIKSD